LALLPAGAQAAPEAEHCSQPEGFGSYTLRACIEATVFGAHPYAYISLEAGHSPCVVRLRWVRSDGLREDPPTVRACPSGAVAHYRVDDDFAVRPGRFQAAASIQRTTDGHVAPAAQSPFITVG
jgi:hypothetical protein